MNFLEFLFGSKEQKTIGEFECTKGTIKDRLLSLAGYVGMQNPVKIVGSSKKGVQITKKDENTYIVTLLAFDPPIEIEWSNTVEESDFLEYVERLIELQKTIAYVNVNHAGGDGIYYQFAVN